MIVFCTTCKGRVQHLEQTLPRNIADNRDYPDCKFVVLDYGDQDIDGTRIYMAQFHSHDIEAGRVAFYSFPTPSVFHMAHAKNMAARCGILEGADILVTLDADNFAAPGFAQYIADNIKTGSFLCPDFPLIDSIPHGPERPARGYAGRLAIRAQDFIKVGGYDEMYDTWRGEDIDLICRLQRSGYEMEHFDNRFLNAVRHNTAIRFKEYPHAQQYENKDEVKIIGARTETIVNYGKFGMGTVYRNFDYSAPIDLPAVPTRIFGIGLHKTATTSLDKAFQILGFDSFHWRTGNEARDIWDEMNANARSKTLEEWYALCDLPIPLLYDKLDRSYPGSKFILTIRNEDVWLKSVERLWDANYNPERWTWDVYPFSNRIHRVLYGRQDFDAQVFLERYRRHNAEVREYFKSRPNDLLVMDMDAYGFTQPLHLGTWWLLCTFLGAPIPTVPYPKEYQTVPVVETRSRDRVHKVNEGFQKWVGFKIESPKADPVFQEFQAWMYTCPVYPGYIDPGYSDSIQALNAKFEEKPLSVSELPTDEEFDVEIASDPVDQELNDLMLEAEQIRDHRNREAQSMESTISNSHEKPDGTDYWKHIADVRRLIIVRNVFGVLVLLAALFVIVAHHELWSVGMPVTVFCSFTAIFVFFSIEARNLKGKISD